MRGVKSVLHILTWMLTVDIILSIDNGSLIFDRIELVSARVSAGVLVKYSSKQII
jgi:hypothetical protein